MRLIKHFLVSDHVSILHQVRLLGVVPTSVTFNNDRSVKQNVAKCIRGNMMNIRKLSVFRRIMRKYQSFSYSL